MTRPFCIAPWTISHATADGFRSACCVDRAKYPYASISAWWNSPELRQLRLDMLQHNPPSTCESCLYHLKSVPLYQAMNETYGDLMEEAVQNTNTATGEYSGTPVQLEFKHHLCNFACHHCHPTSSTTLRGLYQRANLHVPKLGPIYDTPVVLSDEYDDVSYISEKTRLLSWTGGEPFMNPALLGTLSKLKAMGNTQCHMHFSTNGCFQMTPAVRSCLDLLNSFPITVVLSIDGLDETGEFLRHGFSQEVFLDRLAQLRELSNCTIKANICLTNLSILHLEEVVYFCAEEHIELRGQLFTHRPGHYLSYNLLRREVIEEHLKTSCILAGPESLPYVTRFQGMIYRNYKAAYVEDISEDLVKTAELTGRPLDYLFAELADNINCKGYQDDTM